MTTRFPGGFGTLEVPGVPLQAAPAAREFPGEQSHIRQIRAFVAGALRAAPGEDVEEDLVDSALLLVTEVAANAVQHTRSGDPGGSVLVEVHRHAATLTVRVHDQGVRTETPTEGPLVRQLEPDTEFGRGMALVQRLATRWGTRRTSVGRTVWFELDDA